MENEVFAKGRKQKPAGLEHVLFIPVHRLYCVLPGSFDKNARGRGSVRPKNQPDYGSGCAAEIEPVRLC